MTSKKFTESKKFIFGLISLISSIVTLIFTIITMCMYPAIATSITAIASIYIPSSFTFFAILVGGQSFVDYKSSSNDKKTE